MTRATSRCKSFYLSRNLETTYDGANSLTPANFRAIRAAQNVRPSAFAAGSFTVGGVSIKTYEMGDSVTIFDPSETNSPIEVDGLAHDDKMVICLLYTSPSPRDRQKSRMPSSA